MPDLLDASVWLPLSVPDHVHHARALHYWREESSDEVAFCQITALALLSHLTNPRIVGPGALDGAGAWRALKVWLFPAGRADACGAHGPRRVAGALEHDK
jgi:predicted nucleic acid-binding protein